MTATYTPQEKQYYDQLFAIIDKDNTGILPGQDAYPFLTSSNLPTTTLGEVWALADPENNGFLTKDGWYRAARTIGWIQKGGASTVDETLSNKSGPLPTFDKGPPPPAVQPQPTGQRPQPPLSAHNTGTPVLPPLTPADRAKFTRLFAGAGPSNGLVSGDKARDMFLKSNLNYDKLGQIWNLADTQERGSLDLTDFVIGMYLIQSCMTNPNLTLPPTLPNGVYETASGGRAPPPKAPASPISRQHTGGAVPSPVRPQYTGGMIQPQRTGQSATGTGVSTPPRTSNTQKSFASPPTSSSFSTIPSTSSFGGPQRQMSGFTPTAQPWDVTPQAKATSDQFFTQLDSQNKGVIEGDVAVPFMLQSQLDENTLASVWDLADIRKEGKLTRDEFAVAMHLINSKLAGQDVPSSLPNTLVPPSLRDAYGNGAQEVLSSQRPSSATKDLFDVFGDDQPTPTPQVSSPQSQQQAPAQPFSAAAFLPQPPAPPSRKSTAPSSGQRGLSPAPTGQQQIVGGFGMAPFAPAARGGDLLGDDSAEDKPSSVPDHSAEFGNKQNQLANTTRNLSELEKSHAELDETAKSSAALLQELDEKLSSARSRHETETKAVTDLRIKVGEQKERHRKLESEVISAESDLSAMRSEKDELEQALLRDKEEIRGLQKMMKEVEEEKTGMKFVLEKLRKEARQQKGMLSIAKKQLSTAEGSRDSVQKEIKDTEQEIEDDKAELERGPPAASSPQHIASASPPAFFSPSMAAGVPLPPTPKALSPAPTGASTRSNNPFERLAGARSMAPPQQPSQSASPPTEVEQPTSPTFGTGALAGLTAAVGAAAGVAIAGAETLYDSAKEAVTGESSETKTQDDKDKEIDPFGAPTSFDEQKTPVPQGQGEDSDPFGVPPAAADSDPFGATTTPKPADQAGFDDFDNNFGDSFTALPASEPTIPTEDLNLAPASEHAGEALPASGNKDFDSAFADFDQAPPALDENQLALPDDGEAVSEELSEGLPSGIPKSAIPNELTARPEAERTFSTQAVAGESRPATPAPEALSSGLAGSPASVKAPLPPSGLAQEVIPVTTAEAESSDEEEGPEDLEAPKRGYSGGDNTEKRGEFDDFESSFPSNTNLATQEEPATTSPPVAPVAALAPPILSVEEPTPTKTRRHAPPPPSHKSTPPPAIASTASTVGGYSGGEEFDPFGAPVFSTTNTTATESQAPKTAAFDEDDFDFSDSPPATVDQSHQAPSAQGDISGGHQNFDDDFANFDDEFENVTPNNQNNGSDSTQSYEMVSPQIPQAHGQTQGQGETQRFDEWGFGGQPQQHNELASGQAQAQAAPKGFSFDDAFGGDFEPSGSRNVTEDHAFSPPPGPPPAQTQTRTQPEDQLQPPPMPQRRPSGAQPDDIEDVKKLCAMGFTRGLVVEALAANGYDFQKALNVLLSA
ncbi:uncharacterized protein I206_100751 [Kwoniella pini CBS 10737]|uniref:UBA/TS-N domain-containing protein n=1 Tax=Kwoniella pini CBS 10737 TaxID=1296096 RepID=A0A1B9IC85_9TREE|nr:uncharacterized protein I206_00576 [Kwoniella pini CBS 10737]OCF53275.1 hypothetical protein I206_00576 [Kwoniella pini CBS 10737]